MKKLPSKVDTYFNLIEENFPMAQKVKFLFSNVAYQATVHKTGV